jgi:hypothetical protein
MELYAGEDIVPAFQKGMGIIGIRYIEIFIRDIGFQDVGRWILIIMGSKIITHKCIIGGSAFMLAVCQDQGHFIAH